MNRKKQIIGLALLQIAACTIQVPEAIASYACQGAFAWVNTYSQNIVGIWHFSGVETVSYDTTETHDFSGHQFNCRACCLEDRTIESTLTITRLPGGGGFAFQLPGKYATTVTNVNWREDPTRHHHYFRNSSIDCGESFSGKRGTFSGDVAVTIEPIAELDTPGQCTVNLHLQYLDDGSSYTFSMLSPTTLQLDRDPPRIYRKQ